MGYFEDVKRWKDYRSGDPDILSHLKISVPNITGGGVSVTTLKSLNLAKKLGEVIRALTWGDYPIIDVGGDDESTSFVYSVLDNSKFYELCGKYIECLATEGGFFIKAYAFNSGDNESVGLDFYPAEMVQPLRWVNNNLVQAEFISYETLNIQGTKVLATFIENHNLVESTYAITHTVKYLLNGNEVVTKPSAVGMPYLEDVLIEGVNNTMFAYFCSPKTHSDSFNKMYGASIFDGLAGQIEQIDITYNRIGIDMNDNGTTNVLAREAVPDLDSMTDDVQCGRYFSPNRFYQALKYSVDGTIIDPIKRLQSNFHTNDIISGLNKQLRIFEAHCGLSEGTFTDSGDVSKTATEIVSKESATYRTRSMYLESIRNGIIDTINAILTVANAAQAKNYEVESISVKFTDAAEVDTKGLIDELSSAVNAKLLPLSHAIMKYNDCTEEEAKEIMRVMLEDEQFINSITKTESNENTEV